MKKRIGAHVSALVCAAGMSLPAAAWEVTSYVHNFGRSGGEDNRSGLCHATLPIGYGHLGANRGFSGRTSFMALVLGAGTVAARRQAGEDEMKPFLYLWGYGPHHTRSRPSGHPVTQGVPRCSLVPDGKGLVDCNVPHIEHRITYKLGRERPQEAWLLVAMHYGSLMLEELTGVFYAGRVFDAAQYSIWMDWPEEIFATDERQVLHINAGGNSRPDINGLTSPSSLRIELWDSASVMAQLQRCADRHMTNGVFALPEGADPSVLSAPFDGVRLPAQ